MDNNNLKTQAFQTYQSLSSVLGDAQTTLADIIKGCGGILPTPPTMDKTTLYAFVQYDDVRCVYSRNERIPIQAIAFDENEGLMILTNIEVCNYEHDNDFQFEYLYDFDGEDKEHYEDMVKDITYFRPLDDGYTDVFNTIFSIFAGLESYLA